MTAAPAHAGIVDLSPEDLRARLDDALAIYVDAMAYPPGTARQRAPMWDEHTRRSGWRAVAAVDADGRMRGIAYGYPGAPGQWWYEEVRKGLLPRRSRMESRRTTAAREQAHPWLADYFELTELHVDPAAQGHGIGEALLRRLLARVDAGTVLLSTPEADHPTRAWALYRRLGFDDVLRRHRFSSDPRPFAVLGRTLPLPDPGGTATAGDASPDGA
jgi:ribosomal protein S18 acetylase RimI-like enzyme